MRCCACSTRVRDRGNVAASPSTASTTNAGTTMPSRVSYSAGVAASLVAEAMFIAMMRTVSWIRGMDPWMVTRVPASVPSRFSHRGFVAGDVPLGMLMHLMLALVVRLICAALLPRPGVSPRRRRVDHWYAALRL